MRLKTGIATTLFTATSMNAMAHDGHHSTGILSNLWHMFSQPSHWLLLLGAATVIGVTTVLVGKKRHTRPATEPSKP